MTAIAACRTCGTEPLENARFCHACGSPVEDAGIRAEYKQVTVLFADVVHSMDIAAAVGAERLREIIAELVDRASAVIQRYGGTVDKFTGDGIMAMFGAPVALEDHAIRACLAALGIQGEAKLLAVDVHERDGVDLQLRMGLNSGQVIAGEIGSGAFGYTAIGEQVGMARRIESVAPPGGVMVSESTALLVQDRTVLSDPQLVHVKGVRDPVPARLLVDAGRETAETHREQSTLVGRSRELATMMGELERAINGRGRVVEIVGSPGIGKSRIVAETARLASERGVEVISANCESHATDVPLGVAARLLQETFGVGDTEPSVARMKLRALFAVSDADDVLLLEDLLGIRDVADPIPDIAPQASRRRVGRLINTALLERKSPALYVVEDVHWIDEASAGVLAELISVLSRSPSMVLVTHRPEYHGPLLQPTSSTTIVLAPLTDVDTSALVNELLGPHASTTALVAQISEHAGGNPFFAEEIVRDLAARGVLTGTRGAYACPAHPAEVKVPATLEAAIAARIDRLDTKVKRILNTAAVAGASFDASLIATVVDGDTDTPLAALVEAELIDQTRRVPRVQYAFRHPLIRTVAYESQLKSVRVDQHRRLAAAIQQCDAQALDQSAAVIAGHLEAAGDLRAAYMWHMRAAAWSSTRDIRAARISWRHARDLADRLPAADGDRSAMQTMTRTMLCATAWRVGIITADAGFNELQQLCSATGDALSQTVTTALLASARVRDGEVAEAARLAREVVARAESFGDDDTAIRLMANVVVFLLNVGDACEVLRIAQRIIDLADGDPAKGHLPHSSLGSPLALATMTRGAARAALGIDGWKDDLQDAVTMARGFDLTSRAMVMSFVHLVTTSQGWLTPDASAVDESEEILRLAEQFGDDFTLAAACVLRGAVLRHRTDSEAPVGVQMLARARELAERVGVRAWNPLIDIEAAKAKADDGDLDEAIAMLRGLVDEFFNTGEMAWYGVATGALVQALLSRGGDDDAQAAETAIDLLAQTPTEPGVVVYELLLLRLRALLARAHGDEARYREHRDRYRDKARTLGFEGHIAWAEAMP
jgi:class 3 adenylate cyclase